MKNKAFTLLELIIVIIIVGVLASLALPRLFSVIEYARSAEATATITSLRSAVERCALHHNGAYYTNCSGGGSFGWDDLDIPNPRKSPNSHFCYVVDSGNVQKLTITLRIKAVPTAFLRG